MSYSPSSDHPVFWESRYEEQKTPWDLGRVAPPLASLMQEKAEIFAPGTLASLGCGYGHDAAYFGRIGFTVTGFDYVAQAIEQANAQYGPWAQFIQADIFKLDQAFHQQFDYVLEHTCFCALPPYRRADYVKVIKQLLKPNGYYIGLIWADVEGDGPPFPTTQQELSNLFQEDFRLIQMDIPTDSVPDRQNQEIRCVFQYQG